MFSTIIVNDSKPDEQPMCLQGDIVFVVSSKKVGKHYENEATMAIDLEEPCDKNIYLNLGTSIRTMIDQDFSEDEEARARAVFEFAQGVGKRGGTIEGLEVKKEGEHPYGRG